MSIYFHYLPWPEERIPMKGVISGAGVTHMIQFQNPYDPANFGYNSDRICDMLDKVQIF